MAGRLTVKAMQALFILFIFAALLRNAIPQSRKFSSFKSYKDAPPGKKPPHYSRDESVPPEHEYLSRTQKHMLAKRKDPDHKDDAFDGNWSGKRKNPQGAALGKGLRTRDRERKKMKYKLIGETKRGSSSDSRDSSEGESESMRRSRQLRQQNPISHLIGSDTALIPFANIVFRAWKSAVRNPGDYNPAAYGPVRTTSSGSRGNIGIDSKPSSLRTVLPFEVRIQQEYFDGANFSDDLTGSMLLWAFLVVAFLCVVLFFQQQQMQKQKRNPQPNQHQHQQLDSAF